MNCRKARRMIQEFLDSGEERLPAPLMSHTRECARCRDELRAMREANLLLQEWETAPLQQEVMEQTIQHVHEIIHRSRAAERPRTWVWRTAFAGVGLTLFCLGVAIGAWALPRPVRVVEKTVEVPIIVEKEVLVEVPVEVPVVEEKVVIRYVRVRQPGPRPVEVVRVDDERKPTLPEQLVLTQPEETAPDGPDADLPQDDPGPSKSSGVFHQLFVRAHGADGGAAVAIRDDSDGLTNLSWKPRDSVGAETETVYRVFVRRQPVGQQPLGIGAGNAATAETSGT